MKKLERIGKELHHMADGKKVKGANSSMINIEDGLTGHCTWLYGDCLGLSGDCTGLEGNCSDLAGDCTNVEGDCTEVRGNCSGIKGSLNDCGITNEERAMGIDIADLVK